MPARCILYRSLLVIMAWWLVVSALPAQAAPLQQEWCYELVRNGSFETDEFWVLGDEPPLPAFVSSPIVAGTRAMRLGNFDQPAWLESYSTVSQRLQLPFLANNAVLRFQANLRHDPGAGLDRQEVWLLTPGAALGVQSSPAIWSTLSNAGIYQLVEIAIDPANFGRIFDLTFAVYNDGQGGRTWMFVDEVSLQVCVPNPPPTATATPVPSSTPTPIWPTATPLPTPIITPGPIPPGCYDILQNGDFEWTGAWLFGDNALPPFYAGAPPTPPSGSRMMALGAILPGAPTNVPSFSSIQQAVTIPASAQSAYIEFQYYPISSATGGFNRQELVLLDPLNYDETIEVLWRVTENANQWLPMRKDLTRHIGRTVTVYFNARNAGDGNRTAMYLDQVQLVVCDAWEAMPWPDQPDWGQPGPLLTPSPTADSTLVIQDFPPPGNQQTVIAVGTRPPPLAEITPEPAPAPTVTPDQRRDQGAGDGIDLLNSPLAIILVISGIILLAVVLALLFFRGEKEEIK